MYKELPLVSFLVLDYKKQEETFTCLKSIRAFAKFDNQIIYLDNGGNEDYIHEIQKQGLCDVLISKKNGNGGGIGQTDLFRYCNTKYAIFVQNDQILNCALSQDTLNLFISLLDKGYKCIDLNGDQSSRGIWTDRAHFIETAFFNSLAPFPNGGPGNDDAPWNEKYLQDVFERHNFQIAHIKPCVFSDAGKWSIREAGDGIYKHRCDTKEMYILKTPTYKTEVYPPFDTNEWKSVLAGTWINGAIPNQWKSYSFKHWQ